MLIKNRNGMTLIELMIVVAIIGILAAVAIPRFADMTEKAKEGATKGNISAILSAISFYNANNSGREPDDISSVTFANYLDKLPSVRVTHPGNGYQLSGKSNALEIKTDSSVFNTDTDGWRYNNITGGVWVNNGQTDSKGVDYTKYGYE